MNKKKYLYIVCILIISIPAASTRAANEHKPKPVNVTLEFDVYNSTKGKQFSFKENVQERKKITIRIDKLGVPDVDPGRIVVRERHRDGKIGKLVTLSRTGEVALKVPDSDASYDIFLVNSSNKANYDCLDDKKVKMVNNKRFVKVVRRDFGQVGSDGILKDVFKQLNQALNPFGITYGGLNYDRGFTSGDMSAGYGELGEKSIRGQPWFGTHWPNGFVINIKKIGKAYLKAVKAVGLEEAFETYFGVDDICGRESGMMIQLDGRLNSRGKDIIAYYALISPAE
jgi:hypothetical protein